MLHERASRRRRQHRPVQATETHGSGQVAPAEPDGENRQRGAWPRALWEGPAGGGGAEELRRAGGQAEPGPGLEHSAAREGFWPKGILTTAAYDGGEGGAIWSERWIEGANTQGKLQRTMGVNDATHEAALVVEAAQLAGDALVAKYAQVNGAGAAQVASSPALRIDRL